MKITDNTLKVLKNFGSIQPNILIQEGSIIRTIDGASTVYAEYTCPEVFPWICLYDLNQFLQIHSLLGPDVEIDAGNNTMIRIYNTEGEETAIFYMSDPEMLMVPTKTISNISFDVSGIVLKESVLKQLKRAAAILKATHICLESVDVNGINGDLSCQISVLDPKPIRSQSNSMQRILGPYKGTVEFRLIFDLGQLNFVEGDYMIEANSKFAKFTHCGGLDLRYWIAADTKSHCKNRG